MPANRLAGETSPYLLQHAHNPVDWYPWGPEALERARALDRPVFLSIGYAACHWCHVMERESFEDPATAAFLAEHFVAIKVDREERPDLDAVYMDAVQAITGSGGWPMSVFLAPDGRPFYGGTYFPNTRRHGMPRSSTCSRGSRVRGASDAGEVESAATSLAARVGRAVRLSDGEAALDPGLLGAAVEVLEAGFDAQHGGWGGAPEVPPADGHRLPPASRRGRGCPRAVRSRAGPSTGWPRAASSTSWPAASPATPRTRRGSCRTSRRCSTTTPSSRASTSTRGPSPASPAYLRVATATLDFVAREMTLPDGVFAASLDADTGGEEGATYTWTANEVREVLAAADLAHAWPLFAEAYDVIEAGNWEGRVILRRVASDEGLAERHGRTPGEVADLLAAGSRRAARSLAIAGPSRPATTRPSRAGTG